MSAVASPGSPPPTFQAPDPDCRTKALWVLREWSDEAESQAPHITDEALRALVRGHLDDAQRTELVDHLVLCTQCSDAERAAMGI